MANHLTFTAEQRAEFEARNTRHEEWAAQYRKPNGWTVMPPGATPPGGAEVSNAERSAAEEYDWRNDPPDRYFLYVDETASLATTWTGQPLGRVVFGREWRDSFGGKRQSVTVHGTNGATYHGTYYKSSGQYARIRRNKGKRQ